MLTNRIRGGPHDLQALFHTGSLIGATDGQLLERFARHERRGLRVGVRRAGRTEYDPRLAHLPGSAAQRARGSGRLPGDVPCPGAKAGSLWVRDSSRRGSIASRCGPPARPDARRNDAGRSSVAPASCGRRGRVRATTDDSIEVLHREIDRMPERHRAVIVICDLEGHSYEEAARHLRCPVGTVRSRLARARERLREGLARRGVVPTVLDRGIVRLPEGLVASTVRGSVLFATDPIHAAGVVSAWAVALAEGVRKTMIRVRLHAAFLAALAVTGLLAPVWLAVARQAPGDRAEIKAPPAGKAAGPSAVDIAGNWMLRGGERLAVIRIEGPPGQRRARLLSVGNPDAFDLARSMLDHVRIDETTVRFTLQLFRVGSPPDIFPSRSWPTVSATRPGQRCSGAAGSATAVVPGG